MAEVTRGAGTGRSASRGGSDPRDAEVRDLWKQVAELQKKISAKSPEAFAAERCSSSSGSERSECTATIAEMAKMLSDLESKMGLSHPATILLRNQLEEAKKERDGAEPLLEKIQCSEKAAQNRELWRPPLRSETSCSNDCKRSRSSCTKLSRCDGRRRQSSRINAHR